ncbi:MAG: polysaccharide deacetylase family protein [Christensenellaceae bacterium]|jgi:polysaccharide deacetylase family sporulation protein PdaB|nr:polysaccharide deacetylase family protein [Christensenellaceae bacterium]
MILVFKKKTVAIVSALVAITIIGIAIMIGIINVKPTDASTKLIPIYYVKSESKKVALTFDAAWGADKTIGILDILDRNDCKSTFFLTGYWIETYPDLVEEINKRGHLVANHSANHLHMIDSTIDEMSKEIAYVSDKINSLIGKKCEYFRAPYGEYNNTLIKCAESYDLKVVQWNVDTLDWKGRSASDIVQTVEQNTIDGSIILCHNDSANILEALPLMIVALKNKGLSLVTLSELIIKSDYIIENDGRQIVSPK